ncbi:MAG: NADPH:quinone oxidoreductase family protein [Deltaproteobacteria bacterium]|nr:MAG: NADPH:quinone oxidoreductase family protein [Deltaproteobacteria bacterium]
MRAWRVHQYGDYRDVLRWEECEPPPPPSGGVRLRVAASGVNFPDILAIAGRYQVRAPLPFSPGLEAAGVVDAAGAGSRYRPGQRVVAFASWGAHADYMTAPDAAVFPIPDAMTDEHAAALTVIYQTSYFALRWRAALQPGEVLLVHGGAGGVGTSAIQLGKHMGATVIATAGSEAKLQVCRDAGADHVIHHRDADFVAVVRELTGGRGADVIYDPVGGDTFDRSTKCIAFGGRLVVIGFASGRIPDIRANRILLKNISVVGLHWGAYLDHEPDRLRRCHDALCELYAAGAFRPVLYATLPLERYPDALDALRSRDSYGKIVLTTT